MNTLNIAISAIILFVLSEDHQAKAKCLVPTLPNGSYTLDNKTAEAGNVVEDGSLIKLNCDKQFRALTDVIHCGGFGKWVGHLYAKCVPKQFCDTASLPVIEGSCYTFAHKRDECVDLKSYKNFSLGTQLYLKCEKSLTLVGDMDTVCLPGNTWQNSIISPKCRKFCGPPGQIPHGYYTLGGQRLTKDRLHYFPKGSRLMVRCESGYEVKGNRVVSCKNDTFTAVDKIRCEPTSQCCHKPPALKNGYFTIPAGTSTVDDFHCIRPGTTLIGLCLQGFTMKGRSEIHCHTAGGGFEQPGECIREKPISFKTSTAKYCCKPPHHLENGYYIHDGRWLSREDLTCLLPGTTLSVECKWNYQNTGNNTITCSADTNSFDDPGYCEKLNETTTESVKLSESTTEPPVCCERPRRLVNGYYSIGDWPANDNDLDCSSPGTVMRVHCHPGYFLHGRSTTRCLRKKLYFNEPGKCTKNPPTTERRPLRNQVKKARNMYMPPQAQQMCCADPLPAANANLMFMGRPYLFGYDCLSPGSTMEVECLSGYQLYKGNATITCSLESWRFDEPGKCAKLVSARVLDYNPNDRRIIQYDYDDDYDDYEEDYEEGFGFFGKDGAIFGGVTGSLFMLGLGALAWTAMRYYC